MSRISDQLQQVLNDDNSVHGIFQHITRACEIPGWKRFLHERDKSLLATLRKAQLYYAGASPWPDGKTAIDKTAEKFQGDFLVHEVKCLSLGFLVGSTPNPEELFEEGIFFDLKWVKKGTELSEDNDVTSTMAQDLAKHVAGVSNVLGFLNAQGKETLHVWDVWHAALGASSSSLYVAGVKIAQREYEEEVLAGIEQVSSE